MARRHNPLSRFRLVYRRSPLLLKCVVLATILFSIAALTVIRVNIQQANDRKEAARAHAVQTEIDNAHVEQLIQQKDTVEGSKQIATEVLGYVDKDSVYYQVVTNQD